MEAQQSIQKPKAQSQNPEEHFNFVLFFFLEVFFFFFFWSPCAEKPKGHESTIVPNAFGMSYIIGGRKLFLFSHTVVLEDILLVDFITLVVNLYFEDGFYGGQFRTRVLHDMPKPEAQVRPGG